MTVRTNVAITPLVVGVGLATPTTATIDPTNGNRVQVQADCSGLLLYVKNTFAGAKVFAVRAGFNPPSIRSMIPYTHGITTSLGFGGAVVPADFAMSLIQNADAFVVIESARHVQPNDSTGLISPVGEIGDIYIDFEAGFAGTLFVVRLPTDAL